MLLYKKWQSFLLHTEHCQWHHSGSDLDIVKIVFKRTQLRTTSSETPEKILSTAVANTVELPHQPTFRFPSRRSPQTINEHLIQHKCSLQFHSFQITIFYIERTQREIYIHFSSCLFCSSSTQILLRAVLIDECDLLLCELNGKCWPDELFVHLVFCFALAHFSLSCLAAANKSTTWTIDRSSNAEALKICLVEGEKKPPNRDRFCSGTEIRRK